MTAADGLNVAGFIIAGVGGGLGMFGVFKQTNAYFPFRPGQFLEHLFRVGRAYILEGRSEALKQVHAAAKLGEEKVEDRNQSLIGLYLVFCGFSLQLLGSVLLLIAALLGGDARK
jgi:hypothetical protein